MFCEVPNTNIGLVNWQSTWMELKRARFYRDILLEGFATFWWFLGITMAQMNFEGRPSNSYTKAVLGIYLSTILGAWSHINPTGVNSISTLVFVLTKRISVVKGIFYLIVQIASGIGATHLVFSVTPQNITLQVKVPGPRHGVSVASCWIMEFICITIFMLVIMSAIDRRKKSPVISAMPYLTIGFSLFSLTLFAGPYGVSLNPVSAISLAVALNDYSTVWIYATAGPLGGLTAVIVYNFFVFVDSYQCRTADYQAHDIFTSTALLRTDRETGVVNGGFVNSEAKQQDHQFSINITDKMENGCANGLVFNKNNLSTTLTNRLSIYSTPELDELPPGGFPSETASSPDSTSNISKDSYSITF